MFSRRSAKSGYWSEAAAVEHGAADEFAQDVVAAGVAGQHAVADAEHGGANVVGDAAEGDAFARGADGRVGFLRLALDGLDDRREEVGVEAGADALHHRGHALEAHAGVNVARRQRLEHAAVLALELLEDEVPDLAEPPATARGLAVRLAAADVRAVVVEDFRARAAEAVRAELGAIRRPEVVVLAVAVDDFRVEADFLLPDRVRLVVLLVDADAQALGRDFHLLRHEFPGPEDRLALEVVAERKVAEHLEEGVMEGGAADVVHVAGAEAFLAGGGALEAGLAAAHELVFELVHARAGEEERFVLRRRDERVGSQDLVAALLEEPEEPPPHFRCLHFAPSIFRGNCARPPTAAVFISYENPRGSANGMWRP
jgi:hypothetical protein